jgi:hypothetical protein
MDKAPIYDRMDEMVDSWAQANGQWNTAEHKLRREFVRESIERWEYDELLGRHSELKREIEALKAPAKASVGQMPIRPKENRIDAVEIVVSDGPHVTVIVKRMYSIEKYYHSSTGNYTTARLLTLGRKMQNVLALGNLASYGFAIKEDENDQV